MKILLLLAAFVAFEVVLVALIHIARRFVREAETEDTDFAEPPSASIEIDSVGAQHSLGVRSPLFAPPYRHAESLHYRP